MSRSRATGRPACDAAASAARQSELAGSLGGIGKLFPSIASQPAPLQGAAADDGRISERPIAPRAGSSRTLEIRWLATVNQAVKRMADAARAGQCACWIRNSVKDAVEAYEALAAVLGREQVTLFHARFALGDRLRIEQDVTSRFGKDSTDEQRRGQIVVATQVVEQSLDLDFDVMVSDLCPVDRLIQRAGRLQSHRRIPARPAPVLEILAPAWFEDPPDGWLAPPDHGSARVYPDPAVLWRTVRALRGGRLALGADAHALVESVYEDGDTPPAHGRLGEPTTTVRLARVGEHGARPWAEQAEAWLRWPFSQLSVPRRLIAKAAEGDEKEHRALEASQRFVGDVVTVLLRRQEHSDVWIGRAVAERTREGESFDVPVRVVYSARRGLEVHYLQR